MMNKIDNSGQGLAKLGRDEDQYMAHVAQGEMVVPPIISPETRARIEAEMKAVGLSPDEYTVGAGMSINPITGMPEFGWWKKTWKSVKKVIKKAAPIAAVVPGPWQGPAIAYNRGKAVVDLAKGKADLGTVIGAFAGGKTGTASAAGKGNIFGNIKEFVTKGSDGVGLFGNLGKGIGGLKDRAGEFIFKGEDDVGLFGNIGKGIGKFFGGGMGQQTGEIDMSEYTPIPGMPGTYMDKSGNIVSQQDIVGSQSSRFGGLFGGTPGQSRIGLIEDFIKGKPSDPVRGGGIGNIFGGGAQQPGGGIFGGNLAAAGLAGLVGKAAYDAAKEREGGLAATPAVMMDELGRYQLSKELGTGGTRGEFGLGPAPKALEFADGGLVPSKDEINLLIDALDGTINFEEEAQKIMMDFRKKYGSDMYRKIRDNVSNRTFYARRFRSKPRPMDPKFTSSDYYVEGRAIQPSNTIRPAYQNGGIVELDMRDGGESVGPGTGTSDDIPAMLSDGEYVMTAKATRGAGAFNVKKNKSGIELVSGGKPSRKKGVENMRELMNIFEAI